MNNISLYKTKSPFLRFNTVYGKSKSIGVDGGGASRTRKWISQWRKALFPHALPCDASESGRSVFRSSREADGHEPCVGECVAASFQVGGCAWAAHTSWSWQEAHYGLFGRSNRAYRDRTGQAEREGRQGSMAEGHRQGGERHDVQTFFISIGARYKRIRKRPRGKPSPQLYEYKREKLQELERQYEEGRIDLYYADESHVCTEGYVPYGWQLHGEDVHIPSQRIARMNIFGMIDRGNHYEGFTTFERMTADKVLEFLDMFSFRISKQTFVVLDNASVHRCKKIMELRPVWERRGLFLFFLPPYSPHLNIAETLWRIMKGKWIRPCDYKETDTLFYAVNRALASIGDCVSIKYKHYIA